MNDDINKNHDQADEAEAKAQEKAERRESKKRKRMPVSGKSVFTIKKIIEEK